MSVRYLRPQFQQNALVEQATSLGLAPNALGANVARSGQLGIGIRPTQLDGATPAVLNPVVCIVLQTPQMWHPWPKLQEFCRALLETHAKSVTGIDFGYTVNTEEMVIGHDGQSMKVPTRTARGQVNPTFTFQEYTGNVVFNFFKMWMMHIQHPDTNMSLLGANISDRSLIPAWTMSAYSASMLCIQYDPTGLPDRIIDACIITNMFPLETGDIGFERSINQTKIVERSINMSGIVQHHDNINELAYRVADVLQLHRINYQFALPGLAGSVEVAKAIQKELRNFGGIEYESVGTPTMPQLGANQQFNFKGTGGNTAYHDLLSGHSEAFAKTGSAIASQDEPAKLWSDPYPEK